MRTWLLLDCNYLCWRSFHAMGQLRHGDIRTGMMFGFLRDVVHLQDIHNTNKIAFCWDCGTSVRKVVCPTYKQKRHDKKLKPDDELIQKEFYKQMKLLRTKYLREIGFQNIFWQEGYEADDIIAAICETLPEKHEAIIVSSDKDLYQLLSPRILIWNPHKNKAVTADSFSREWGLTPSQWVDVKAMAGCHTDEVPGIPGVGEKTAAKFLRGKLKAESAAFQKIVKGNKLWKKNKQLVKIPYPGTEVFELAARDQINEKKWKEITKELGMQSLLNTPPKGRRDEKTKRKTKEKFRGW